MHKYYNHRRFCFYLYRREDGLTSRIKLLLSRKKRGISPVVATLVLVVVVVASVTSFALLISGFQTQAENHNDQLQNEKNEDLQISTLQLYPPNWDTVNITGLNMTISNLNTDPSGLVGVEINGNYTAFSTIGDANLSPYSVLSNGNYTQINSTQIIQGRGTLHLELNLSADAFQEPIPRSSSIIINLLTMAQNIFSFSIYPPVANFITQDVSPGDELLNASSSFSPDTGIQLYNWNFVGLNSGAGAGINSTTPTLSGQFVQYFPVTTMSLVTLSVVDNYGLVSKDIQVIPNPLGSTTSSTPPSSSGISGPFPSCTNADTDMADFVCSYTTQLEKIRQVLMTPYSPGTTQSYGYYMPVGLTCGGNIEPSGLIGVNNGYNNVCVVTDNNIEGGGALDYFNSADSILNTSAQFSAWNFQEYSGSSIASMTCSDASCSLNTNILGTVRNYLTPSDNPSWTISTGWYGIGSCPALQPVFYPSSFTPLVDRREGEYGFTDLYASQLVSGTYKIGGIGNSCGTEGQTWYAEDQPLSPGGAGQVSYVIGPQSDELGTGTSATPYIVTEMPGGVVGPGSNLEELSFYIDVLYMQCVAGTAPCTGPGSWQYVYAHDAMTQYPFEAPRQALHFIQVSRATQAWLLTNVTVDGLTPLQMLQIAVAQIFTPSTQTGPMGVGGALGPDGGLYQQWGGGGSSNTPEPNMQAMIAFDPQMPYWFTNSSCIAAGFATCVEPTY